MTRSPLRRFLSHVFKSGNGCWIWMGAVRRWSKEKWDGGYGAFWSGGRVHRAHKWIYEKLVARVRGGMVLVHTCDDRRCVNIWHVYPDTQKANVKDMILKGRMKLFGKRFPEAIRN